MDWRRLGHSVSIGCEETILHLSCVAKPIPLSFSVLDSGAFFRIRRHLVLSTKRTHSTPKALVVHRSSLAVSDILGPYAHASREIGTCQAGESADFWRFTGWNRHIDKEQGVGPRIPRGRALGLSHHQRLKKPMWTAALRTRLARYAIGVHTDFVSV